jgi:hypothetical protein
MTSNNLEVYLRAEAIKIEVLSMQSEDNERYSRGLSAAYSENCYLSKAEEMSNLIKEIC